MCGISGLYHVAPVRPASRSCVEGMAAVLAHRGPDDGTVYLDGPVGLGHRRLSIIDVAGGAQPIFNEDRSKAIIFNGEIYNFRPLTEHLKQRGHIFQTHSDTEAILHAYEEYGEDCVRHLRGMFAFAIWDAAKQELFLARDRVGIKPLYYRWDGSTFSFASEIKGILAAPGVSRQIDPLALDDYLTYLYIPAPRTIFRDIRKLHAGHTLTVGRDGPLEPREYWDLRFTSSNGLGEEEAAGLLLEKLRESVATHLESEVPLGAFLSGGIDSSAVVGLMAGLMDRPVITASIGFRDPSHDELPYARAVADRFRTAAYEKTVDPSAALILDRLAWHYDEPFADSSAVPTYYVSQTARQRVTVALSGDGGDENFAGYRRYAFDLRENFVRGLVPAFLRRPVFRALGRLYPKADYLPQVFRGKAFLSNLARDPVDAYFFSVSAFDDNEKQRVLGADVARQLGDYRTADLFRDVYQRAPARDHLSRIQYLDIKTFLVDDILTKVDRAAMAVSLEVRCPLLDHVFMEYAAGIPSELKLSGSAGKRIFKQALKKHLPDDILYRPKMGFGVPVPEWLRGDLKNYARELVLEGDATRRYLSRPSVERLWREHASGLRNRATELWVIMMLNLWHRRFVEG